MKLWIDRETWSEVDLKEVGSYKYAETAEDLLVAYAIDDEEPKVWDVTEDPICPDDLYEAALQADEVFAHNAMFDRTIHRYQDAIPQIELERWRCTMAQALSHALPGKLSSLCEVLGVAEDLAKLKEGKKLLNLFTKPQPANRKIRRATRLTHPAEWERFKKYAANDILAMRECHRLMPAWNWDESAIREWHLDQRINDRGFFVDTDLTAAGKLAAEQEKQRLAARFRELTRGVVDRPTQREQFKAFVLSEFGVELEDTTKDTFEQMIKAKQATGRLKELMEICMAANKTSTAKYAALDPAVQADGRFRGGLQFAGASRTRRWAGRLFQAQNLPARGLPPPQQVELYIEHLKTNTHDLMFDDLMKLGSAALRGCVIAPPKKKLVIADLSNIEGRKLAWFAQEKWKLDAFRAYDNGTGPDLYNITATSIIGGDPWNVPKKDRNVFGKVPDLASGYQGGVSGYQKFAHAYGVRMADHWETMQKAIPQEHIIQARKNLEMWGRAQIEELEIDELEWVASETCKLAWRHRHPATVQFWRNLQDAAKAAIENPGQVFRVPPFLTLKCVNHKGQRWLVVKLPSGRYLTYFDAHIVKSTKIDKDGYERTEKTIAYFGESSDDGSGKRMWQRIFTHGGKMTGNVCQTSARDTLAPALQEAEDMGYLPVLSVHDEGIAEVPDTPEYDVEGLVAILARNRDWNQGLPLAAAGAVTYRYFKD